MGQNAGATGWIRVVMLVSLLALLAGNGFGYVYRLAWDAATGPGVVGYHVYRSASGGSWTRLTASPVQGLQYCDENVAERTVYHYSVTAVDANGVESNPSEPLEVYTGTYGDMCGDELCRANDLVLLANFLSGNLASGDARIASYRRVDMDDSFRLDSVDLSMLNYYIVN